MTAPDGGAGPAVSGADSPGPAGGASLATVLIALVVGQICLHSTMAGTRMAAPLWVLGQAHAQWVVGLLIGLFAAAPIVLALHAGRLADRHGYHRPLQLAVALSVGGGACAVLATFVAPHDFIVLCLAAVLTGAGANLGLITIQRTAGRSARGGTELKRVFSWLGLAPALSNVVGPVLAGGLIDAFGFRAAFVALALLPLLALGWARRVPREVIAARPAGERAPGSWDLLRTPGLRRLLAVNWLLSASWDVHTFVVPILGHERGFSASAIGLVLGVFAAAVALVRLAIPVLAHRLRESQVLSGAMLATAAVFAAYPFVHTAWAMAACAVLLGLALGAVQPMIMTTLHQLTPHDRHGEAIALRSMTINFSSALMPLVFGFAGAAIGAATLFWVMGAAVAAGSLQARRLGSAPEPIRT
jgi:MFS family permease